MISFCLEQSLIWFYDFVGPMLKKKLGTLLTTRRSTMSHGLFILRLSFLFHMTFSMKMIQNWCVIYRSGKRSDMARLLSYSESHEADSKCESHGREVDSPPGVSSYRHCFQSWLQLFPFFKCWLQVMSYLIFVNFGTPQHYLKEHQEVSKFVTK